MPTASAFVSAYHPGRAPGESSLFFAYHENKILHRIVDGVPVLPDRAPGGATWTSYIGQADGQDCFCVDLSEEDPGAAYRDAEEGLAFDNLRALFGRLDPRRMAAARYAQHILHWHRTSVFCGSCGSPTREKQDERAKTCPACGAVIYPRISPAVIVAVLKGDRILLAHNKRFSLPVYSLIAGFVEPGETLEDCVRREVLEEAGITVGQVRYFSSQPWPFPDSLMVGFTAEYESGEIHIGDEELLDAGWFHPPAMPRLPQVDSISRRIIDWYLTEYLPARLPGR